MLETSLCIPPLLLYAETHFRFFRGFPSLIFKRWPEILFDAPRRIDPGQDLPVLLIINDINRFPVTVNTVDIVCYQKSTGQRKLTFTDIEPYRLPHFFDRQCAVYCFTIARSLLTDEPAALNGLAHVMRKKTKRSVLNDNYYGSLNRQLQCVVTSEYLPNQSDCFYGDFHVHSGFSQSHVEFGPPIAAIQRIARASGLNGVAITDHSYDLACAADNYLKIDPSGARWMALREEADALKGTPPPMMCGEEISCLNSNGKVVHLCALGIKSFIPGSLDGARKNARHEPQLSITQAIQNINDQNGLCYAAHPGSKPGFLQRIFLHRGRWTSRDLDAELHAFQAVNSGFGPSWLRARTLWISALLSGKKLPLLAGSDAHGDFNRYIAIKHPFVSAGFNDKRYFGYTRTGVYGRITGQKDLFDAIKQGRTFVTSGPFIQLAIGGTSTTEIVLTIFNTQEFGNIDRYIIYGGVLGQSTEKIIAQESFNADRPLSYRKLITIPAYFPLSNSYVRAEVFCTSPYAARTQAATSAVYLSAMA